MEPMTALDVPLTMPLTDSSSASDVLRALALVRFASGEEPWCRDADLRALPADADMTPCGGRVERQLVDVDKELLVRGDGWTMLLQRWSSGRGRVVVTAVHEDLADEVSQAILKQDDHPALDDRHVHIGFWNSGCPRPQRRVRAVAAPAWPEIRRNYTAGVAAAVDQLVGRSGTGGGGRLLLFHGAPGTGKSTLLRALAKAWSGWCRTELVVDPERLFGDSAYLTSLLLHEDSQRDFPEEEALDEPRPGRLIVLEDCDEVMRAKAKQHIGQSLSRLLNLTDGLIGEGLGVFVCITTNERLEALHPAVIRPGRCLANVEVPALSRAEAAAWLGVGEREVPSDGMTLAELLARRGDLPRIDTPATTAARPGMYL
jgi:hypothetical protein